MKKAGVILILLSSLMLLVTAIGVAYLWNQNSSLRMNQLSFENDKSNFKMEQKEFEQKKASYEVDLTVLKEEQAKLEIEKNELEEKKATFEKEKDKLKKENEEMEASKKVNTPSNSSATSKNTHTIDPKKEKIAKEIAQIDTQLSNIEYQKTQYPEYHQEYRNLLQLQLELLEKKKSLVSQLN